MIIWNIIKSLFSIFSQSNEPQKNKKTNDDDDWEFECEICEELLDDCECEDNN